MNFFLFLSVLLALTWVLSQMSQAFALRNSELISRLIFSEEKSFTRRFAQTLVAVLLDPSAKAQILQAAQTQSLRLRSWRLNLLWLVLHPFSRWGTFLAGALVLNVNGWWVFGLGLVLEFLLSFFSQRGFAMPLVWLGLFLVLAESSLRLSAVWAPGPESTWAFWLADGRPLMMMAMMLAAMALSFLIRREDLFFVAALLGLFAGVLSVNGAFALVLGERGGQLLAAWWDRRDPSPASRHWRQGLMWSLGLGLSLSLFLAGWARELWPWGGSWGLESLGARLDLFLTLLLVSEAVFLAVGMVWGHFAALRAPEDVFSPLRLNEKALRSGLFRFGVIQAWRTQMALRQREILRLRAQFSEAEWQQVPPPVRQASERELEDLKTQDRRLETHLLSRVDFFADHRA